MKRIIIISCVLFYLSFSFICLDLDFRNWNIFLRIIFVIIQLALFIIIITKPYEN